MVEQQILETVKEDENGLLQSEVWKKFDIDSKKASRIVRDLEERGLIRREQATSNGSQTYRIKYNEDDSAMITLFSGDELSPCIDCSDECRPSFCGPLANWAAAE